MSDDENTKPTNQTSRRGFASMDPARQREIASLGGKASHRMGVGHEWGTDAAREAGRKGGIASHRARRERQAAEAAATVRETTDVPTESKPTTE